MPEREPLLQPWDAEYSVGFGGKRNRADKLLVADRLPLGEEIFLTIQGDGRSVHVTMPADSARSLVERVMLVGGFHVPVEEDKENLLTLIDCLREKEAQLMKIWVREGTSNSLTLALERVRRMRKKYEADLKELQS